MLDAAVALLLWLGGLFVSESINDLLLPEVSWLHLSVVFLAVSPVAIYARWRGHISFFHSDIALLLPWTVFCGVFADFLMDNSYCIPFAAVIGFSVLLRVRRWLHRHSEDAVQC